MKKTVKKLVLAKETVRDLERVVLEQAQGGSSGCPTIYGWTGCWSNPHDEHS